jgi:iron complex outermembrane receptor protein
MNKKLVAMGAVSLVLSMSVVDSAHAEDAPVAAPVSTAEVTPEATTTSAAHQVLGDVVVSASKISQSSVEAPANVTVFSASKIEKTNSTRIGDVLNAKVPSLYLRGAALGNSRGGATAQITMRGQGTFLGKTAVVVDGLNMVDAYSGQINWSMISMDEVDRIEVVPGVGSSLYGTNAIGGVIAITTKAPTKKEISFKVGMGFGDAKGKSASALYRNKFENGLGVVFGLSENDRVGYAAELVTKTPTGVPTGTAVVVNGAKLTKTILGAPTYIVGDKGPNGSKESHVHGKLNFDLSPTSKLNAGFAYAENKNSNSEVHSYLTNASTGVALPVTTTATNLNLNGKATTIKESDFYTSYPGGNTALRYYAGYDGEVFGDNKISFSIGKIDRDSWFSSAGATATRAGGAGTLTNSPNSTTNALAQLSFPLGDRQFLISGWAAEIGTMNLKKYSTSDWTNMATKTALLDKVDAKSVTNSLFVQDQVSLSNALTVYLSGRYDSWKSGGTGVVITGSYPGTFVYADRTDNAFSPKIAGVYQFSENFSLKSSVGKGFRVPTNYLLYANPTFSGAAAPNGRMIYANPNLKPEKAQAFDFGTEYVFGNGGNIKATYFVTKTTDLIYAKVTKVPTYTDTVINRVIDYVSNNENTGDALARGVELSGDYPLMSWLTVNGSYTYNDAKITSDATNTGMLGKYMTQLPKQMATLGMDANIGNWSGAVSARYVGELFSNNDNSDTTKDVWTGYSKFTVVDLKVGYRINKNYKVSLMVNNLLNREYFEYYVMPARNAVVEFAGNF